MYFVLISLNIIILIIGSLLLIASYFFQTLIIGCIIFKLYFLFIGVQSLLLGILLTFKNKGRRFPLAKILNTLNLSSKYLIIILLLIGTIIVFNNISIMSGGGPDVINGKYVLSDKEYIIKEISYEDYMYFQLLNFRNNLIVAIFFNILDIFFLKYIFKNSLNQD